jgi:hypothetical protein
MEYKKIEITDIDFQDTLFSIKSLKPMVRQWDETDFALNPIWVQCINNNQYRIIDGFMRVKHLKENDDAKSLWAFVFPDTDKLSQLWVQRISIKEIEQDLPLLLVLQNLVNFPGLWEDTNPEPDVALKLRDYAVSSSHLIKTELIGLIEFLEKYCQFCDLNHLTFKEMIQLSKRNTEDLAATSQIFNGLQLKGNKLSSMIQLMDELAKGYDFTPRKLLQKPDIVDIINNTPIHLKYKSLKACLSSLRWPVLKEQRENWQRKLKKIKIPGRLDISVDPNFESDEVKFTLSASTHEDFTNLLDQVQEKASLDEFAQLFDFV